MKKLLAVCLMALVCWVCAGYAEETRVGDTVIFGQYEQDGNLDNGSEPIAWLVLDVQGGKALLMSRYALDCLPFHDEKTDAAWNQSALNAWLQADFRAAFTDAEWAAIAPVTLADTAADGNPEWQNTDAEPAETHVFLLSYAQVMQYLPEQEQRKVSGTEYARSRGAKFLGFTTIGIGETDWWLRSPGKESYDACFLDVRGAVGTKCVTVDENQQPVFIKTLGDSVTLWFDLEQDIDALNGNAQLSLAADANGYDQQFGIPKTNFGRGTLIVRHTDYQNAKNEPAVYTDYLLAKGTTGANTRIVLHEEGDYEVALDYEVQDSELTHITSKFGNYRIFLRFSIRNGNCMVYPFDLLTGAELQNTSVAEAGFSLDLARSRYLDINVRRAVLVETANGVIEDERFNRPAKDGDRYTQEGIYTISVSNRYTGESITKTIFVGSQELLETYVRNGFSLERLK